MSRFTARAENGNVFYPHCFEHCQGAPDTDACINCNYYDRLLKRFAELEDLAEQEYKEIRNNVIDEFAKKLHEKCDSVINVKWNDETAPTSWSHAYADFKDDIDDMVEQMKGN